MTFETTFESCAAELPSAMKNMIHLLSPVSEVPVTQLMSSVLRMEEIKGVRFKVGVYRWLC